MFPDDSRFEARPSSLMIKHRVRNSRLLALRVKTFLLWVSLRVKRNCGQEAVLLKTGAVAQF